MRYFNWLDIDLPVSLVNTLIQHPSGLGLKENNKRKLMKIGFENQKGHSEFQEDALMYYASLCSISLSSAFR
jgi:hypothetical protein